MLHNFDITEDYIMLKSARTPLTAWDKKTYQLIGKVDIPMGLKLNNGRMVFSDNKCVYEIIK
jgi:hypothetical protein